jgi:hypothetical protein
MLLYSSRRRCEPQVYLLRNNSFLPTATAALFGCLRVCAPALLFAGLAASGQQLVPAQPVARADDPGHFEIRSATAELRSGVYFLNARIEYRLSSEARAALESGVPLTLRLDVELLNTRRFWFDNEDAALRQRYQLEYHALSERYIVLNINSGDQASFATLFAALAYVGRVEQLPLLDAALLDSGRDYDLRLRVALDVEQFPGPLRLLAFWRRDWSLASDWYRWRLQRD